MHVETTEIPAIRILAPRKFGDRRGYFSETFNRKTFAAAGLPVDWVQDNHAMSAQVGTIRGLHFQIPPMAQTKLVRVGRGAILDVAVDIRRGSPTFGKHVARIVSAEAWNQILVPVGFAHGYCTLEPDTEVLYKVTELYSPENERGIRWNDPALGIDWRTADGAAMLSDKDRALPLLADCPAYFTYERP
jgi:dTDP-4-dehydrorhamnose 3,5-epimerase